MRVLGLGLLPLFARLIDHAEARNTCKSTPKDASWPSISQWNQLNTSLSGHLIHPSPPALACHSPYSGSNQTCTNITSAWTTFDFHRDDPVSTAWNNMNNDSCLPDSSTPCSGLGYPVYVVNATSAREVKLAIDFARENNVRLNVKASGHDYLKRSATPYSLSIWTRYMVGEYKVHDDFMPQNCNHTINTTAVTVQGATSVSDLYSFLDPYNQTAVDGMGPEVTVGGYLTGGGHSPISNIFGVGSDQVYEVEMVTPMGDIVIANECQNTDLFWAVRGGGGSTFGVLTKVTIRTVPSTPIAVYNFVIETKPNSTAFWDSVTYLLQQFPALSDSNVAAFTYFYPNTSDLSTFEGLFALYDPASTTELADLLEPIVSHINQTWTNQINTTVTSTIFSNFYGMFLEYQDNDGAGVDKVVGSRLLPPETLTQTAFKEALITFMGEAGGRLYMVSGKGVWDAQPKGGSDAVNPAWRKALIHAVTSQDWTPLDETERATVEHSIDKIQVEAFRQLTPGSGSYLNEAYWNEPNFQQAFFGSNYERLHRIKKAVDPDDVFWCNTCVGNEGWKEVGDYLCQV